MTTSVQVNKGMCVSTDKVKIENYLTVKKWSQIGSGYLSPCRNFTICLDVLGCQLAITHLAFIEKREPYNLWLDIEEQSTRII